MSVNTPIVSSPAPTFPAVIRTPTTGDNTKNALLTEAQDIAQALGHIKGTMVGSASPTFTGTVTCEALTASGLVTCNGGIAVTGAATCTTLTASGLVTCGAGLSVTGTAACGAITCTTLAASGAVTCATTLAVTGVTTCAALTASGQVTCGAGLSVTGTAACAAVTCTTLAASGAATIGAALAVGGTAPSTPAVNTLYGDTICKAWAYFTIDSGVVTIHDDVNVASVTISLGTIAIVTFARPMANANFSVTFGVDEIDTQATGNGARTTSSFQFNITESSTASLRNLSSSGPYPISIQVFGRQ